MDAEGRLGAGTIPRGTRQGDIKTAPKAYASLENPKAQAWPNSEDNSYKVVEKEAMTMKVLDSEPIGKYPDGTMSASFGLHGSEWDFEKDCKVPATDPATNQPYVGHEINRVLNQG